jgi:hypothetical protein
VKLKAFIDFGQTRQFCRVHSAAGELGYEPGFYPANAPNRMVCMEGKPKSLELRTIWEIKDQQSFPRLVSAFIK